MDHGGVIVRSTHAFSCAVLLALLSGCVNLTPEDDGFGTSLGQSDSAKGVNPIAQRAADAAPPEGTMAKLTSKLTAAFDTDKPKPLPNDNDAEAVSVFTPIAPSTAEYHVTVARVHERAKRVPEAKDHYQKALKLDPKHVPAIVGLARLQDRQGNMAAATKLYTDAIAKQPREAALYNDLGLCHARRKNFSQAVSAMNKAVEIEPRRQLYRNNLAMVLVETNRADLAVEHLSAVNDPAIAHYNVGYLLQKRGQNAAALSHFQQAVKLNPEYQPAQQWVAKLTGTAPEQLARQSSAAVTRPSRQAATQPSIVVDVAVVPATLPDPAAPPIKLPPVGQDAGLADAPTPESIDEYLDANENPLRPRTVAYHGVEALPAVDENYRPPSRY